MVSRLGRFFLKKKVFGEVEVVRVFPVFFPSRRRRFLLLSRSASFSFALLLVAAARSLFLSSTLSLSLPLSISLSLSLSIALSLSLSRLSHCRCRPGPLSTKKGPATRGCLGIERAEKMAVCLSRRPFDGRLFFSSILVSVPLAQRLRAPAIRFFGYVN